jgi:hypothetical protein
VNGYTGGVFGWSAIGRAALGAGVALLLWGAVTWALATG